MNIELLPYQARAADQIARRYATLTTDPERPWEKQNWATPFYQALSALTGSGKTAILADAVAQLRTQMVGEPIVLWISKAKAVVEQTFANLSSGGKYRGLVEGFLVEQMSNIDESRVRDGSQPVIALTTVGAFNQEKRGEGSLKVHKVTRDSGEASLWHRLRERKDADGNRRPLLIVYDEAQNLADQQVDLLFELEPDAILVASATMKTPGKLGRIIDRLTYAGWTDAVGDGEDQPERGLVTAVPSGAVVEAGLVKRQVVLGGYATEMETALNDMMAEFRATTEKAIDLSAGFLPKAIYVCRTNINAEDGSTDMPTKPFRERKAPPILIWRHLVEQLGVDPTEIAVYCDLKLDRKYNPPPPGFVLFSGGEDDFAAFSEGPYRHIIFNLSLQEGWDDPACAFAYIDKSMGSAIQAEQVIGRVLRQPGARHYPDPDLNTANFYIRIDNRQEFPRILEAVRRKVAAEMPEVKLEGFSDPRERSRARLEPKSVLTIPEIHIDADDAVGPLQEVISLIPDYTRDAVNVVGPGELTRARQRVGDGSAAEIVTEQREHSNRVVARWVVRRAMQASYPEAAKTVDWADPRFEALVEITSRAAADLRDRAERLVDTFIDNADLTFEDSNPYTVASVLTKPDKVEPFLNAGHKGYSDLSDIEMECAKAIDALGLTWVRNPSNGGYSIPLLEKGGSRRFYPDFVVWKDDLVYALDPKGKHLIKNDASVKLMSIRDETGKERVLVRLITEGKWKYDPIREGTRDGFSVWRINAAGKPRCTHHDTMEAAVRKALDL
ncbi:DEAD/DEAH box helicase family protein [Methylorubrum sp. SB2]|uniref:DEAD/DEAH box helicase family protein n=1 Tax=Methylorubrum subtropicum TaxID=3138812 RepID=UPI00313EF85A